jgi:hypothetical protein
MKNLKWHPAAEAFPMIVGDDLKAFTEDVKAHGIRVPIEIYGGDRWPEYKGWGLDGRNRLSAAQACDIEPPTRTVTDAEVGDSLTSYIASLNVSRRHLTSSQAAMVGVSIKKQYEKEAKKASLANLKKGDKAPEGQIIVPREDAEIPEENDDNKQANKSAEKAAKTVGTNRQYITDAERIGEQSPELANLIRAGELTIPQAKTALKLREANPDEFKLLAGGGSFEDFTSRVMLKTDHPELYSRVKRGKTKLADAVKEVKDEQAERRKAEKAQPVEPPPVEPAPAPKLHEPEADPLPVVKATDGGLVDRLGRPVPPELTEAFAAITRFRSAIQTIGRLTKQVKDDKAGPAGAWMDNATANHLENAKLQLRFASPYCVCPDCDGNGGTLPKTCPSCKGAGYLCEGNFSRLNKDQQEKAKSFGPEPVGDAYEPEAEAA